VAFPLAIAGLFHFRAAGSAPAFVGQFEGLRHGFISARICPTVKRMQLFEQRIEAERRFGRR
jgi:hypothetical protein